MGFKIKNGVLEKYKGWRKKIVIPEGVKVIGGWSFAYNQRITSVILHEGVTKIEEGAFAECRNLKNVAITNSVKEIESWAFRLCDKLVDISLPENIIIGDDTFRGCRSLADKNGFVIFENVLYGYFGNDESIAIPDNITKISGWSFYENKTLTTIKVPCQVTEIGYSAFRSCPNLTSVYIPAGVTKIDDNVFFETNKVVIYTPSGSFAERYARENDIPFVAE